ncbi:MAG: hypothetical protein AAGI69_30025 [Cyanobacteria bacterium P01_H01_bin.21]
MSTTFRSWGGWSIGLWLLIGQGAIANPHSAKAASANVSPANLNLSETTDRLAQVARPVEITDIQIAETAAGFTLQLETNGELETPDCLFAWLRQNDVYFGTPTLKSEIRVY